MKKRKKTLCAKPFTLVEILLVIAIIGMSVGLFVVKAPSLFRKESFNKSVDELSAKIERAQELMLDYSVDVKLLISQTDTGLKCLYSTEKEFPLDELRKLNRHCEITGINSFTWNGESRGHLILNFDSAQNSISKGLLSLKGNHEATLFLPGEPGPIQKELTKKVNADLDSLYPDEVNHPKATSFEQGTNA